MKMKKFINRCLVLIMCIVTVSISLRAAQTKEETLLSPIISALKEDAPDSLKKAQDALLKLEREEGWPLDVLFGQYQKEIDFANPASEKFHTWFQKQIEEGIKQEKLVPQSYDAIKKDIERAFLTGDSGRDFSVHLNFIQKHDGLQGLKRLYDYFQSAYKHDPHMYGFMQNLKTRIDTLNALTAARGRHESTQRPSVIRKLPPIPEKQAGRMSKLPEKGGAAVPSATVTTTVAPTSELESSWGPEKMTEAEKEEFRKHMAAREAEARLLGHAPKEAATGPRQTEEEMTQGIAHATEALRQMRPEEREALRRRAMGGSLEESEVGLEESASSWLPGASEKR